MLQRLYFIGFWYLIAVSLVLAVDLISKELDIDTYLKWSTLTLEERLPYLMDKFMIHDLKQEYAKFVATDVAGSNHEDLTLPVLLHCLSEFQSEKGIRRYFDECDADRNDIIDIVEYSVCRGYNEIHGNPSDVSEYDVLENVVLDSYKEKYIDNPNIRSPLYKYDENGIIID